MPMLGLTKNSDFKAEQRPDPLGYAAPRRVLDVVDHDELVPGRSGLEVPDAPEPPAHGHEQTVADP